MVSGFDMDFLPFALDPDISLVLGLFLIGLAFVSGLAALADSRWPLIGIALAIFGGLAVAYAWQQTPGGFTPQSAVMVIYELIGRVLH